MRVYWLSSYNKPSYRPPILPMSQQSWPRAFLVDAALLVASSPLLLFPDWFAGWGAPVGVGLLVLAWLWRRWQLGAWARRTPLDGPILFLLLVSLPVSLWVAPPDLRAELSIPRALILLWDICLFYTVATHAAHSRHLYNFYAAAFAANGLLIAIAAFFGTSWASKLPGLTAAMRQMPTPLVGIFAGAEGGFNPNQVAGALLFVWPWLLAAAAYYSGRRRWPLAAWSSFAALLIGLILVASQSRGGMMGGLVGLLFLLLLPQRRGRWLLGGGLLLVGVGLLFVDLPGLTGALGELLHFEAADASRSLSGRQEIWQAALQILDRFGLTGIGLGTFRRLVYLLAPLSIGGPNTDLAHAHNFFLQTALDLGVPGLVGMLALYLGAAAHQIAILRTSASREERLWATGFLAALLAQSVYSLTDAVALGSKPGFLLWYLLALMVTRRQPPRRHRRRPADWE